MVKPKKQIQKREKVFNFVSKVIDLIKNQWRTIIFFLCVILFIYVLFWIDTVAEIKFEIIYMQECDNECKRYGNDV